MNTATRPSFWRDLLWALPALIVLMIVWTFIVTRLIEPDSLMLGEPTVSKIFLWLIAVPALLIGMVLGWRHLSPHPPEAAAAAPAAAAEQTTHPQDYTLEIIGLGVTLDQYRQGALWEALRKGSPWITIRNQDPQKVDWSRRDKSGTSGGRVGHTIENGLSPLPYYWGTPVLNAEPPSYKLNEEEQMRKYPAYGMGFAGDLSSDGIDDIMTIGCDRVLAERPDHLLDKVFAFFDANPDVPYIVLTSNDDPDSRDQLAAPGTPKLQYDGNYIPAMPDASVAFVLARRERVDALRPFAFHDVVDGREHNVSVEDLNRYGLGRRLYLMWDALKGTLPSDHRDAPPKYTPDQIAVMDLVKNDPDTLGPYPQEAEWKRAVALFATRPDLHAHGISSLLPMHAPFVPANWKPTPWFPIPWSKEQIEDFDKLPTFGFLHRPVWVKLTDEHGKRLEHAETRRAVLAKGWAEAITRIPEALREAGPARVILATGDNNEHLIDLHRVLDTYHEAQPKTPNYDANKPEVFVNTDRRLGNTGAATLFMQMAIGTLASYADGGPSMAINYRDGNEVSLVLITPPSDAVRKKQGSYPLRDRATPYIDPANYAGPNG